MSFFFFRAFKTCSIFLIFLLGQLCTQSYASDVSERVKELDIGTYVEGAYFSGAQKKRFRGYVNRTQGYVVTIVTNQLPYRRRIPYRSIDHLRVKKTKRIAVQFNPQARRFLTRSSVIPGHRAVIGVLETADSRFEGVIASVSDSLIVLADTHNRDEYKILTASELDQLSINLSKTSHIGKGFKAGLVTGFCIGVIFSSSDLNRSTETGWSALANIVLSPKTVVISGVGAGIGSIIGKLASYETWQSIPLDRLKFNRSHTPLSLSASYSF
ncbi:MAG: hypothetical protein OXI94_00645 [Gemmatimonadota bacterium]|nr:hypothetical protein [Gemmatimonadota bacterium]